MKCNKVFIIATAAVMIAQNILAQDDMYFTPRKKAQGATTVTSQVVDDDAPYRYRIPADAADGETVDYGNSDRDVDEYNRRGGSAGDYSQRPVYDDSGTISRQEYEDYAYSRQMERFDDYYGQKPSFKNLIIRAIPETSSRTIELESGGIDVAYNIHHTDLKRIAESPRLKLLRRPSFRSEYIGLNCEKAPLNDVRVRKAIALAINTAAMQRVVWRGIGYAPNGPLPKGFPYCDETIPAHEVNIEKAKALLKEAGIKDGLTLEIWTNESKERVDAATIIQSMMAEIGITLNIKVMEYGTFLDGCRQGKHDLFVSGWGNNLPDPEYTFGRTFHSKGIGGNNYSFYKNAAFDAAMDEGLRLPDGPERAEAYKKVQQYLLDEVPALWWSVNETIFGVNKNIESFDINTRGMPRLWLTTFAK